MTGFARRDFLAAAAVAAMAPLAIQANESPGKNCIVLVLTGGPSQLDTWDMKPGAPSEIRGPFRPIRTNVPGIQISEIFPRMAKQADKYAVVRSVYSDASPHSHENGQRAMDDATGGFVTLKGPLGQNCRRARQLVEAGTRFVRIDMYDTIFQRVTWDSHGTSPFSSTLSDYKNTVGPAFDLAYSSLLLDLHERGLLDTTLVVAMGEFGRTPRINPSGGRDHWTKCWTVLMAGGGIRGGQVYGSSDATGSEPKDSPVHVDRILATIRESAGMRTGGSSVVAPVRELFS